MKKFTLEIVCDGAAFSGYGLREFNSLSTEIAEILQGVARSIQTEQPLDHGPFRHTIHDSNATACGWLAFTTETETEDD